jgi:hypothetical protein
MIVRIFGTRFQLSLGDLRFTIGLSVDAQQSGDGQDETS